MRTTRRHALLALPLTGLLALTLGLSGCGGSPGGTPAADPATSAAAPADALTVTDAWVKTGEAAGMTAAFGLVRNSSSQDVTVTSASTPAAGTVELHEVAMVDGAMTMRPKEGGFVVPAGGTHALAPGGDHVMLMGLRAALAPGDSIPVTLTWDGGSLTFDAVIKDFSGANETYGATPVATP